MSNLAQLKQSKCRSCHKPLYWLKHETTGKVAPIEQDVSADGNCMVDLAAGTYRVLNAQQLPGFPDTLHRNHFLGCPDALRFASGKATQS